MPGRLMADKDSLPGQPPLQHATKYSLANGIKPATPTATPPPRPHPEQSVKPTPGLNGSTSKASASLGLPPEIEHITAGFYPVADLYQRIAQQCFSDLVDLIENMPQPAAQANGTSSVQLAALPTSSENAERRRRWMNFGKNHRDRFIKLLVLSRWFDKADDLSKLIDINNFLIQEEMRRLTVIWDMEKLMFELQRIKIPSPDMETAVTILSRGEDPRVPTLRLIPPKPLTAEKALHTLREINTLLHIRLNRDEELPSYLQDFRIGNGRATFTVPTEFELEVYVALEDSASPLCFTNLRFLFTPNIEIPQHFLNQLDLRINGMLQAHGLKGCFQMLHEFVLTHKINLMRRQAHALNTRTWPGMLKVEHIHRSLIVQYWRNRPGKKSWIEVGVNLGSLPGQDNKGKERDPAQLGVRWFVAGKQMEGAQLPLPQQELSIETTLRSAIAQHTSKILSSLDRSGKGTVHTSDVDPEECYLEIPFGSAPPQQKIRAMIDYRSGNFVLQPWSKAATYYEEALNELRDPETEAWPRLEAFQQSIMRQNVERMAQQDGMAIVRDVDLRGKVMAQRTCLLQPQSWSDGWRLVYAVNHNVESWIAVKSHETGMFSRRAVGFVVPICGATSKRPKDVAHYALSKISALGLRNELDRKGLRYEFLPLRRGQAPTAKVNISPIVPGMTIQLILQGPDRQSAGRHSTHGDKVTYLLKGKLRLSTVLANILSKAPQNEIEFDDDGSFTMTLRHGLGSASLLEDALTRLQTLSRLKSLLDALHRKQLEPEVATIESVVFGYSASDSRLKARLGFSLEQGGLHLSFLPRNNPQLRLARVVNVWLAQGLRRTENETSLFCGLVEMLQQTLPAMQSLYALEAKDRSGTMAISAVEPECLRIGYLGGAGFQMTMHRSVHSSPRWIVSAIRLGANEDRTAQTQLQELSKGDGRRRGFRRELSVGLDEASTVLEPLDRILRPPITSEQASVVKEGPGQATMPNKAAQAQTNGGRNTAVVNGSGAKPMEAQARAGQGKGHAMVKIKEEPRNNVVVLD